MYIKPLSAIIDSHSVIHQSFADDLQLQISAIGVVVRMSILDTKG